MSPNPLCGGNSFALTKAERSLGSGLSTVVNPNVMPAICHTVCLAA
jgi:hypothetical protein